MAIDSNPQPCPRCWRPTVLVTRRWGREWIHLGTWRSQCGELSRTAGVSVPETSSSAA